MTSYFQQRLINLRVWRAFSRSIGIFITVVLTFITKNPIESLGKGILIWLLFYLIRKLDDNFVDRNLWESCSSCFYILSFHVTKILLLIIGGIVSFNLGSSLGETLLVFGGLLIYDFYFVKVYGI